ncbi:hypothetical protein LP421_19785 [Rhizobium sp. RCAM05350]|nr:hypothetical protein LP421_19785 [Rhizobium sp. RCAM05350]
MKTSRNTIAATMLAAAIASAMPITIAFAVDKEGGHWGDPLLSYGRPMITNLRMDPFERQDGNVNRQMSERKTWALTPIVNIDVQHLQTFKDFPIRQRGMSADVGKTIEDVQSQILKLNQAN